MSRKKVVPADEVVAELPADEVVAAVSPTVITVRNCRAGGGKISVCGITVDHGGVAVFERKSKEIEFAVKIGLIEYVND